VWGDQADVDAVEVGGRRRELHHARYLYGIGERLGRGGRRGQAECPAGSGRCVSSLADHEPAGSGYGAESRRRDQGAEEAAPRASLRGVEGGVLRGIRYRAGTQQVKGSDAYQAGHDGRDGVRQRPTGQGCAGAGDSEQADRDCRDARSAPRDEPDDSAEDHQDDRDAAHEDGLVARTERTDRELLRRGRGRVDQRGAHRQQGRGDRVDDRCHQVAHPDGSARGCDTRLCT